MTRCTIWTILLLGCSTVVVAQTQLSRTVLGSGGEVGAENGVATGPRLSATIGQSLITTQTKPDGNALYQGFWLPLVGDVVGVDDADGESAYADLSNYPNPFASQTTVRLGVPLDGRVTVRVYSITGNVVSTTTHYVTPAGSQELHVLSVDDQGSPMASGIYLYEVEGTTANGRAYRRTQQFTILR